MRRLQGIATALILLAALFVLVFPLSYLLATSLKSNAELYSTTPTIWPKNPTLEPYGSVLFDRNGVTVLAFDWAGFPFALVLTATDKAMTFPVGVQGLVSQFEIIWNDMAAGGVIAIAFPLLLMILARKYVMTGLTFGVVRNT